MKRCGTCRHWDRPTDDTIGEVPGSGRCKAVVLYWEATTWEDTKNGLFRRTLKPEYAHAKAFAKDGSDYWAELCTLATFGCVQHEPLEQS